MRVLLSTEFAASRKEPLVEMFDRVFAAFLSSGVGEPTLEFQFADSPTADGVSSVARGVKRFPSIEPFCSETSPIPPFPATRRISNQGVGGEMDRETLRALLAGVPRSFPFHSISLTFRASALGEGAFQSRVGSISPGVGLLDSWWINGRNRSLSAITAVEGEVSGKRLPPFSEAVTALYAALGKVKRTAQIPLLGENPAHALAAKPETLDAVRAVVSRYREQLPGRLQQIPFPHDLPPVQEARQETALGETTGPKKPVLVRAFGPMGYDCKAGSGSFTLRRRTAGNLTLELSLDVGTWSRKLTGFFAVQGLGFRAPIGIALSRNVGSGHYPIGDSERWRQLVENMAAFVADLEANLVPAVEAAAGPSPDWYTP